ncbi:MAG TPA: serine/threonine-protein kinase [Opitutaceae bacterium]|nr:serine/threonine-protein kinase [Opitutaceae bacterium]
MDGSLETPPPQAEPRAAKPSVVSGEPSFPPGYLLDGRFRIQETIGRSGMATIYRSIDAAGHEVAIKVPLRHIESDPVGFARFRREEEVGLRLNHPNIIRVTEVPAKSRPYMVMEYLRGETLDVVARRSRPMPEPDALRIAARVCDALQYLHDQDIVHCDLKPSNIMLCADGSLRLFDLGLSSAPLRRRSVLARFGQVFGTPEYMAPEQVENGAIDGRTDLYSLGAILYELLTGEVPFRRDDPWQSAFARTSGDPIAPRILNPAVSVAAEEIVLHAMCREPGERYVTAAAFRRELLMPGAVVMRGYGDRLRAPRWKLSLQGTPLVAGTLLGIGGLGLMVAGFLVLWLLSGKK